MSKPLSLVIGATGTVGTELVTQLVAAGYPVRALVRDPSKAKKFDSRVEIAVGDLLQPRILEPAFAGIHKAFVVAPPVANLEELEANAFAAAEYASVEQIVYLSNFGAGQFEGDLWQAHTSSEQRLQAGQTGWTILRPTRFMTNTPYSWKSVRETGQLMESHGGHKVTLIDPRDIAAVAVKALTSAGHEGKIYELTGDALTGKEMAQRLSAALLRPIKFVEVGEESLRNDLLGSGIPAQIVEKILYYFSTVRAGRWYETSTLRELLGGAPRSYADWVKQYASAFH